MRWRCEAGKVTAGLASQGHALQTSFGSSLKTKPLLALATSFHPDAEGNLARIKPGRQTRFARLADRLGPTGLVDSFVDVVEVPYKACRRRRVHQVLDVDSVARRHTVAQAARDLALLVVRLAVRHASSAVARRRLGAKATHHFRQFRFYQLEKTRS